MNTIHLNNTSINKHKITYDYEIKGEWKPFFNLEDKMWVEYSKDISNIPTSIAVIPFLTNILPISWLCDAKIVIDEIDEDFYESISNFKEGYTKMYPSLKFNGEIVANKIVNNKQRDKLKNGSGSFFSGGVDAFSTLFSHIEERPTLITLWGADVIFDDKLGWDRVKSHVSEVSELYNLDKLFIKSNFRYFINEIKLNELVSSSGDSWWHGFQCGIGLVGHAAPYAFKNNFYGVYIASSYTPDYKGTTASTPNTDGKVKFSGSSIYHDQYETNRQEKIENIVNYSKFDNKPVSLRVCWKSTGGSNCCSCEKCYRTMMGLLAENADPKDFGFSYTEDVKNRMIHDLRKKIVIDKTTLPFWKDIQSRFINNQRNSSINKDFDWFIKKDVSKLNYNLSKTIGRILRKVKRIYKVSI